MRWNSEVYYGISVFVFLWTEISGIGFIKLVKCLLAIMQVMFSRPIRWIMALHGDAIVPFTFAGILR